MKLSCVDFAVGCACPPCAALMSERHYCGWKSNPEWQRNNRGQYSETAWLSHISGRFGVEGIGNRMNYLYMEEDGGDFVRCHC